MPPTSPSPRRPLIEFETPRLRLRQWRPEDVTPFAEMNADPQVMRFFPAPLSTAESEAMAQRIHSLIAEQGWGLWAVEESGGAPFIGFVGLHRPSADLPFSPCVEIAWRLARPFWRRGYATEAARGALAVGFGRLGLDEIVAFTTVTNQPSRAVMERLGMQRDAATFQHPQLPPAHPLREHVLYRLHAEAWRTGMPDTPGM